jgi:hypothetical protein
MLDASKTYPIRATTRAAHACKLRGASSMCAPGVGNKMQLMEAAEAALVRHEGIHRLKFAHMPSNSMMRHPRHHLHGTFSESA